MRKGGGRRACRLKFQGRKLHSHPLSNFHHLALCLLPGAIDAVRASALLTLAPRYCTARPPPAASSPDRAWDALEARTVSASACDTSCACKEGKQGGRVGGLVQCRGRLIACAHTVSASACDTSCACKEGKQGGEWVACFGAEAV